MPDLSYLSARSSLNGIGVGCIYGLIGIGFCVIYNASGIVNFAQGAFVMLGGMVTYVAIPRPRPAAARSPALVAIARSSRCSACSSSGWWCVRCGTATPPCS